MTTIQDVLGYIAQEATEADIERLYDVIKTRSRYLRDARAAQVTVGTQVRLANISPKYLMDLEGTVHSINGKRATVELTKEATETLRWTSKRFFIAPDIERYLLGGVPLSSCVITEGAQA